MKKENVFLKSVSLFITFFKVGLFTFGGGYAMIPIIQKEVVEKKKWISGVDLLDILAISESTPGPISVNAATFVGYKVAGFLGALFSTLALATPSFIILLLISTFYDNFLALEFVNKAFLGLKVGVIILLINAVIKLAKLIKFSKIGFVCSAITLLGMLLDSFLNLKIPSLSIIFIVLGLIVGLISEIISSHTRKEKK